MDLTQQKRICIVVYYEGALHSPKSEAAEGKHLKQGFDYKKNVNFNKSPLFELYY